LFASFDGINRFYARSEEPDLVARLAPASVLDNFVSENLNRVEGYVRHLEAELKARSAHVAELETFVGRQEEIIQARDRRIAELEARVGRPRPLGGGKRTR
jgi:aminoglycoside phosphotransferase family enzyme